MDSEPVKRLKLESTFQEGLKKARELEQMILEAGKNDQRRSNSKQKLAKSTRKTN